MAKVKSKTVTISPEDIDRLNRRDEAMERVASKNFNIIKADIKDDYCNYKYELISGPGSGAVHTVADSTHVIEGSLRKAFEKFNVHLAIISGSFKESATIVDDVDKFHDHELTDLFTVTGFEIFGTEVDKKIKYVEEARGRMEIKTHKVPLDNLGGYNWYNELRQAADDAILEVALYKEGFYVPAKDDEEEDPAQGEMEFQQTGNTTEEVF